MSTSCPNCGNPITVSNDEDLIKEIQNLKTLVKGTSKTSDQWMDMKSVCDFTSLSESSIRRAIADSKLRCSSATGKLLFKKQWVEDWLCGDE